MNTENIYHHLLTNLDIIMTIGHTLYTMGVTFGAGTGYPSDGPEFTLGLLGRSSCSIFSFMQCFVDHCIFCPFYLGHCIVNEWIHMSKMLPTELMSASTVMYKGNLFDGFVILLYITV